MEKIGNRMVASSDIYKLNGEMILKGEYEISWNEKTSTYSLKERFHEFEDLQSDLDLWNEYELTRISPHIIGNPDLEGHQCFHPLDASINEIPLPSIWTSNYNDLDHGVTSLLVMGDDISCWKFGVILILLFCANLC